MLPPRYMLAIKNQAAKILVIFLAVVTLFAACAPPGPRALLRGKKLLERGKYEEAAEELRTAVALLSGTNAQAYNYLGLACHQGGQTAEAEKAYQKALALNPDLSEARYNLGCLALDQGKFEQARSEFTAYTLRRPNSVDGWLKLGMAQLRQAQSVATHTHSAQLAAAEKSFSEGLRLNPQNPEGLTGLGLVALQRGQSDEARQFFIRAWKTGQSYRPALLDVAIVEQQYLGERQAALAHYRQYLALKPAPVDSAAVKNLVRQLEQELAPPPPQAFPRSTSPAQTSSAPFKASAPEPGRTSTVAKASAQDAIPASAPARPEAPSNIAKPSSVTTPPKTPTAPPRTGPATDVEVVRLPPEPTLRAAQDSLPSATATTSQPTPAQLPEPPIASPPVVADSKLPRYPYRALAKPVSGNRSEAERAFAQGVQAHQANRLPEAIASYDRALRLDPSYYDACYNLALAATQLGNLTSALSAYESALAIRPDSSDARYNFALVLKQAKYSADAANELEKVVAAYPNDSRAHLALANLYSQQLQQPDKARQHYLKVLETDPRNPQAPAIRSWLTDPAH